MDYTRFGEELRVLRTRRHQNQQEMADILGVTKNFLSMVEKREEGYSEEMDRHSDRTLSFKAISKTDPGGCCRSFQDPDQDRSERRSAL